MLKTLVGSIFILLFSFSTLALVQNGDCDNKGVLTPLEQQLRLSQALIKKTFRLSTDHRRAICRGIRNRSPNSRLTLKSFLGEVARQNGLTPKLLVTEYLDEFNCENGRSIVGTTFDTHFTNIGPLVEAGMSPNILIKSDDGSYTTLLSEAYKRYRETKDRKWREAVHYFKKIGGKKCKKLKPNPCIN